MSDVLVVGCGVVGKNLLEELHVLMPDAYDKYNPRFRSKADGKRYGIAFICVDTPYVSEDLPCDLSQVRDAIGETDAELYVIKSTVPVGTTDALKAETGKRIVFSPEYYGGTQHCNNFDFDFTILGGAKEDCSEVVQVLQDVYDARHTFRIVDPKVAEMVKYMENAWLATKVTFCIGFKESCDKAGIMYEEVRELFNLDPRVNPAHTFVYRDHPFYKSHCLDKDVPSIARQFGDPLLEAVVEINSERVRKHGSAE